MAYDLEAGFKIPFKRRLFFKLKAHDLINKWRGRKRHRLGVSEDKTPVVFDPELNAESCFAVDWEAAKTHYARHGWFLCDPFLADKFDAKVRADWPDRLFLIPPRKVDKWYNTGFNWMRNSVEPRYLDHHSGIKELIAALGSGFFLSHLSDLADCPMEFTEFHITDSGEGAEVPMHLDSLLQGENGDKAIGIAIFVDGTGGARSGGLCVNRSSDWNDVLHEPMKLRNTALIYSKKLHHGFLPIEKGKFRHSINTQFWPEGSKDT